MTSCWSPRSAVRAPVEERLVHPIERPKGADESFLGDVLGEQGIPQRPVDEPVDARHVAPVELLEGPHVAGPVGRDELGIGPLDRLLTQASSSRTALAAASSTSSAAWASRYSTAWFSSPIWYTR